mmetsp:Transcript_52181/g.138185  ORF Transcript_52181/g.138185 Transcript_52181/m.138185 type:complete len:221 (-) Transcript_52181:1894-2556(-)
MPRPLRSCWPGAPAETHRRLTTLRTPLIVWDFCPGGAAASGARRAFFRREISSVWMAPGPRLCAPRISAGLPQKCCTLCRSNLAPAWHPEHLVPSCVTKASPPLQSRCAWPAPGARWSADPRNACSPPSWSTAARWRAARGCRLVGTASCSAGPVSPPHTEASRATTASGGTAPGHGAYQPRAWWYLSCDMQRHWRLVFPLPPVMSATSTAKTATNLWGF